jgi:hypothetical protein
MKLTFTPPTIIGALCEREDEIPVPLLRRFARLKPRIAFLPFRVEHRYLKNVVACMKLMDIQGLAVFGRHQREIVCHLSSLSPAARQAGMVDVVLRKGRRLQGHHVLSTLPQKGSERKLMGLFYQAAVDLLTAG